MAAFAVRPPDPSSIPFVHNKLFHVYIAVFFQKGVEQTFGLGQFLRNNYKDFVSEDYFSDEVC